MDIQSFVTEVFSWPAIFGTIAREGVNLIQPWSHYVRLDFTLFCMHTRRYPSGRFLPYNNQEDIFNPKPEEPHRKIKEIFENPFVAAQEWIPPSSNESFHLNDLFSKPE